MENKDVYKFNGKEYCLSEEIVKGGCQGCAFYNRIDCYKAKVGDKTRSQICNEHHKIFKRLLNHK